MYLNNDIVSDAILIILLCLMRSRFLMIIKTLFPLD